MKNLQESINYTIEQKQSQVNSSTDSHFEDTKKELYGFLKDTESDTTTGLNFGYLAKWYQWNFMNDYLQKKELAYHLLAKSTLLAEQANKWKYNIGLLSVHYDSAIQFSDAVMHLGQMMYLGWWDKAQEYGYLLLKMLYGKQYTGWIASVPHSWFIIELFCKWQAIELNKDKLNYPKNMSYYGGALTNWNTQEMPYFVEFIELLSAYHIKNSDEYGTKVKVEDGYDFHSHEFDSADYFIFPVEILTWLAIRKKIGLPNGDLSHIPLMQLSINQFPSIPIPYPSDDLVELCWVKLQKDNPTVKLER